MYVGGIFIFHFSIFIPAPSLLIPSSPHFDINSIIARHIPLLKMKFNKSVLDQIALTHSGAGGAFSTRVVNGAGGVSPTHVVKNMMHTSTSVAATERCCDNKTCGMGTLGANLFLPQGLSPHPHPTSKSTQPFPQLRPEKRRVLGKRLFNPKYSLLLLLLLPSSVCGVSINNAVEVIVQSIATFVVVSGAVCLSLVMATSGDGFSISNDGGGNDNNADDDLELASDAVTIGSTHHSFVSDSDDTTIATGILCDKDTESGIEILYWVENKSLIHKVTSFLDTGCSSFVFIPYTSKESWWSNYPAFPILKDIVEVEDQDIGFDIVIPSGTLISHLSEDEKNALPQIIKIALENFVMSEVDEQEGSEHVGMPCFECRSCQDKITYSSLEMASKVIVSTTGQACPTLVTHLNGCDKFQKTHATDFENSKICYRTEAVKRDYRDIREAIIIRLCRYNTGKVIIYDHQAMIDRAKVVNGMVKESNSKNGNHVPVHKLYETSGVINLINEILTVIISNDKQWTFSDTKKLFEKHVDVDVTKFREDWTEFNHGKRQMSTLKLCFIYTMRYMQVACAKCGEKFDQSKPIFGVVNGDMNHIEADGAEIGSAEANSKSFDVNRDSCSFQFWRIVAEIVECQMECKRCHNVFGSFRPYDKLDENLHGRCDDGTEYDQTGNGILVFSDIQKTSECQNLHQAIKNLLSSNFMSLAYQKLAANINQVQRFNMLDITHFREDDWNDCNDRKKRQRMLKEIEYYYERRSIGQCFMCLQNFVNAPLREFCSLEGHHVDPEGKDHAPSNYGHYSLENGRLERRKCVPLCAGCHRKVHNVDSYSDTFGEKFYNKYVLNDDGVVQLKLV